MAGLLKDLVAYQNIMRRNVNNMTLLERILKDNNYTYTKGMGNDYIIAYNREPLILIDQNGSSMLEVIAKANGLDYANVRPEFEDYDELNDLITELVETQIWLMGRRKRRGGK